MDGIPCSNRSHAWIYTRELLALTYWSVAEVANAAGFDDPYYFSRLRRAALARVVPVQVTVRRHG